MNSQSLVVDTIRDWKCGRLLGDSSVEVKELDYANVSLVTQEPEYYGNAEYSMTILWDTLSPIDDTNPRNEKINQLMRSFVHHWNLIIKAVRHDGLTTYVDCKTTDKTQNHSGFDWIDVIAPKADLV